MCMESQQHMGAQVRGGAAHTPVSELRAGPRPARGLLACVPVVGAAAAPGASQLEPLHQATGQAGTATLCSVWPHTDLSSSCRLRNESLCVHGSFQGSGSVLPFPS